MNAGSFSVKVALYLAGNPDVAEVDSRWLEERFKTDATGVLNGMRHGVQKGYFHKTVALDSKSRRHRNVYTRGPSLLKLVAR